jgi:hypothetical protein
VESMETQATFTPGMASGGSQPGIAQPLSISPAPKSTPEQRAAWREKYRLRKARKAGQTLGPDLSAALPPLPDATGAPDPALSPGANPPPVPWDSETLKPLFETLVPAIEKADVESIAKKAAAISPDLLPTVRADAPWNPAAKATIQSTAPAVAAKWLNAAGIGAENAGEVALGIAAITIFTSRMMLMGKLNEMAEKGKEQKPDATPV